MTLQFLPPPNSSPFEFDSDIKDGIRPSFLDKVCSYVHALWSSGM